VSSDTGFFVPCFLCPDLAVAQAGGGGVVLDGSREAGSLLYHHSCSAGLSRTGKSVITVRVGLAPGWSNSTA
jgi:hypothetical protein